MTQLAPIDAQLAEELYEARVAKRLRNDFLGDFFKDKEKILYEAFKDVPLGNTEALVNLHHQIKSLNSLQMEIESVINTGKMAQVEQNKILDKAKT